MTPGKKVILVVSFGTSYPETRRRTIGAVENDIAGRFPDWEVRRAFTSRMIIKKLAGEGVRIDHVTDAMERLIEDGVKVVVIQPTHVMNGTEYDDMMHTVAVYAPSFDFVSVGAPLLTSAADYRSVISAIEDSILSVPEASSPNTALVLMGHGSEHFANSTYSELQLRMMFAGHKDVYVTTVEGFPSFQDTLSLMRGKGYTDVILHPFMLVAGDHAVNDMAGDGEDSLRSAMSAEGYGVHCILKGLGEYPSFRSLFAAHAEQAMGRIPP